MVSTCAVCGFAGIVIGVMLMAVVQRHQSTIQARLFQLIPAPAPADRCIFCDQPAKPACLTCDRHTPPLSWELEAEGKKPPASVHDISDRRHRRDV